MIDRKCQDDPEFKLCEIKAEIHKWSQSPDYQALKRKGTKLLNIDEASEEFNDLLREVVFYTIKHIFVENIAAVIRNTFGLISA